MAASLKGDWSKWARFLWSSCVDLSERMLAKKQAHAGHHRSPQRAISRSVPKNLCQRQLVVVDTTNGDPYKVDNVDYH